MKVTCLFLIIILSYSVLAVNEIYPIDFNKKSNHLITLKEKQGIEFLEPIGGILLVERINQDGVIFKVILDSNKFWGEITVKENQETNFDMDRDNEDDVRIFVSNIGSDYADLRVNSIKYISSTEDLDDISGEAVKEIDSNFNLNGILITIAIIIAGLIVYLIFIKKK